MVGELIKYVSLSCCPVGKSKQKGRRQLLGHRSVAPAAGSAKMGTLDGAYVPTGPAEHYQLCFRSRLQVKRDGSP